MNNRDFVCPRCGGWLEQYYGDEFGCDTCDYTVDFQARDEKMRRNKNKYQEKEDNQTNQPKQAREAREIREAREVKQGNR